VQVNEKLYIGGEWVKPETSATIDVVSPHTEEVIGRVPDASPADMDRAVAAARNAFDEGPWPRMTPAERAEGIKRLSGAVQSRAQELADTISSENGSPKSWSLMGQVFSATMVLDTYAGLASGYGWEDRRTGALGTPVLVRRAPEAAVGLADPGRTAPDDPAQARVEPVAAGSERAELVLLVDRAVDYVHDPRPQPATLEVGRHRHSLDVAGPEGGLARVEQPLDDRRVRKDAAVGVLRHDVNAGTDRLPVPVPILLERGHAQVGEARPFGCG